MYRVLLMIAVLRICADCFVFTQMLPSSQITPRRLSFDEPYMWTLTTTPSSPQGSEFDDASKNPLNKKAGTRAILDLLRNYWAPELATSDRDSGEKVESEDNQEFLKRQSGSAVPRGGHRFHRGGTMGNFFPSPKLIPSSWIRYTGDRKATPRVG